LACFIESRLNLSGSSMFNRQSKTARAGMIPRPRDRRHTALRWFGPKLLFNVKSGGSIEGDGEHEHPIEHQWDKRGDHETHVNHAVGREGEPTVLGTL